MLRNVVAENVRVKTINAKKERERERRENKRRMYMQEKKRERKSFSTVESGLCILFRPFHHSANNNITIPSLHHNGIIIVPRIIIKTPFLCPSSLS